jgi:hypothetical protein
MPEAREFVTVEEIDREITKAIRRLTWLQKQRDDLAGVNHRGPRGPKGRVTYGKTKLQRRALSATEEQIISTLKEYPKGLWSTQELIDGTKLKRNTLVNSLTQLVKVGYVHRVSRGQYQINRELVHD